MITCFEFIIPKIVSFSLLSYFVPKYIGLLNTALRNTEVVFYGHKQLTVITIIIIIIIIIIIMFLKG